VTDSELTAPATAGRRPGRLIRTGLLATLAATAATTVTAAAARSAGVDFEIPAGGEAIPLPGFAVVTAFLSAVGVTLADALLRRSTRPATHFVRTTLLLTALSLLPPLAAGADTPTTTTLLGLHLVPAAVMIPTLTRSLRGATG